MNRKQFIKNLSGIGLLAFLPNYLQASTNSTNYTIHFLGLGGAGSNALLAFSKQNLKGTFTVIDSQFNENLLNDKKVKAYKWKESGYTSDNNWSDIKQMINSKINNTASTKEHYVLLLGLGGTTGVGIMIGLADILKYEKKDYTVITTVPFCFEKRRQELAMESIKVLQPNINLKYVFADNLRIKYPGLKMKDAMITLDKEMYDVWLNEAAKLNLTKSVLNCSNSISYK